MKIKLTIFALLAFLSFSVINAQITVPAAALPVNEAMEQTLTPTFTWGGGGSYILQFASEPTFTILVHTTASVASGYVYSGPALSYNTKYYWRASDNGGLGYSSFTTSLATPVITSLAAPPACINLTPTITWTYSGPTTGVTFDLVYNSGGPSTTIYNVTSGYSGTTFTANTAYSFQIIAKKTGFADKSSLASTFQTTFLTSPAYNATSTPLAPNFTWNNPVAFGGANYTIDIDTDPNFGSIDYTFGGIAVTSYALPVADRLVNGLVYYWRITANGGANAIGKFSTIAPSIPYLASPSHLANIVGNTILFQWTSLGTGIKYKIEVDDDPAFTTQATNFPSASFIPLNYFNYSYTLTTLPSNDYWWRVMAYNSTGELIGISPAWRFAIPGPPTGIPAYPINLQTVYSTSPTIYWYLNNYFYNSTVYYRVRYSLASHNTAYWANANNGAVSPTTSGQYMTLSDLLVGNNYYYVVDASTSSNFTTFTTSAEASFSVFYSSVTLDGVAIFLSYPANGTYVYSTNPSLYWFLAMQIPGVTFDIQVDKTSSAFGDKIVDVTDVSAYNYSLSSLTPNTQYWWRVRLHTTGGTNQWYGPETFTVHPSATSTSSVAAVPTLFSPLSGSVISTQNPTVFWNGNSSASLEYQVIWSSNPTLNVAAPFGLTNVSAPNGGSSIWLGVTSYVIPNLTPGVTYYWQVRSRLSATPATMSNYSSVGQFTVAAGASPVVVLPANPIIGSLINSNAVNLSWIIPAKSESILTYDLELSKNKDFSGAQVVNNLTASNYQANNLSSKTNYYWRVKSKNSSGISSSYSYSGSFNTGSTTAIHNNELPAQFELSQNYPNPFNPSTTISFSIPNQAFVSLKVFDMLGREVKTLLNQEMVAGKHNLNWNGDNNYGNRVASGTYIYRISAGAIVSTKKMILIK